MNITVAGTGYVGLVAGVCFAEVGHNVICVDINEEKIDTLKKGFSPIYEKDLETLLQKNILAGRIRFTTDYKSAYKSPDAVFIGVGTPELPDGSANLTYIAIVARQIAENIEKDCLVVVKSTVPVGTNDKVEQFIRDFLINDVHIEVASNPEFLKQGDAVHDTLHAPRIIIGTESKKAEVLLKKIYEPFNIPIVSVKRRSSEMIKYACNNFLALKISYMNDIANLCELVGADILDVSKGMSYDERIGPKFLDAGIGFGGSCFPKDTKALTFLAKQYNYELSTVNAAIHINTKQKLRLFEKAKDRLITFNGLKVAVLGLTFKPETDDLREAPSISNIQKLLEFGADIYAYDPVGIENSKKILPETKSVNGSLKYVTTPEEALRNASVCFIFTEWDVIKKIEPSLFKKLMKPAIVYDGRNIFSKQKMFEENIEYYSIGR